MLHTVSDVLRQIEPHLESQMVMAEATSMLSQMKDMAMQMLATLKVRATHRERHIHIQTHTRDTHVQEHG